MNSVDRQNLANTIAGLLFLLLVYAATFDLEPSRQSSDPETRCTASES